MTTFHTDDDDDDVPPLKHTRPPLHRWDNDSGKWCALPQLQHRRKCDSVSLHRLSVLTYNVWRSTTWDRLRYPKIVSLIESLEPHVVCFQEVTGRFFKFLLESPFIRKHFFLSDVSGATFGPYSQYGVVIMSKFRPSDLRVYSLPTSMGRTLVTYELNLNSERMLIGNVHLESLNTAHVRLQQMKVLRKVFSDYSRGLVLGDFNFDSHRNFELKPGPLENNAMKRILSDHVDLWEYLNKDDRGHTFDCKVNLMLDLWEPQMRYDRILFKDNHQTSSWRPTSIRLVGNEPLSHLTLKRVFPSDHFGVLAHVDHRSKEQHQQKDDDEDEEGSLCDNGSVSRQEDVHR